MSSKHCPARVPIRQRGAAFLVSLVMLLVLTLVGVTAMRLSNAELLITNSYQNESEAFVAAENSVRVAERDLEDNFAGAPAFDFSDDGDGYYEAGTAAAHQYEWYGISYESGDAAGSQYVVEYLGPAPAAGGSLAMGAGSASSSQYVYRVIGRGTSSKGSVRLVETIYTSTE